MRSEPIVPAFLRVHALLRITAIASLAFTGAASRAGELGELLRATLDHPSVEARAEETRAARDSLHAATGRYFGDGNLNAAFARYEDERFIGVLSPSTFAVPPFDRSSSRYGITYSVPIDLFGAISAARRAARSSVEAAELAERQQILLKLHDATSAYVQLQALHRQQMAVAAQRQRVTTTLDRVRQEVKVQLAAGVDLKLAESEVARIASDEVRLRGSIEETRARLLEASGRTVESPDAALRIPAWPLPIDQDQALPLLLARAETTANRAQAEEARRALLPGIAAVGEYSQFEGTSGVPDAWSVGAVITIPLSMSANRRASALDARARAAARREVAAAGEITLQWSALKAAYDSAVADVSALEQEMSARREVVSVQLELHRVGVTSMEDLLRQQRDLVDAQSRHAAAQARAVVAWSAAQVLLGAEPAAYVAQLQ